MKLHTKKVIAREGLILLCSIIFIWIYIVLRKDARILEITGCWLISNLIIRFFFWSIKTLITKPPKQ